MYLHIGEDTSILVNELVAILNVGSMDGELKKEISEKTRSVVVCSKNKIYHTPVSSQTIVKRLYWRINK